MQSNVSTMVKTYSCHRICKYIWCETPVCFNYKHSDGGTCGPCHVTLVSLVNHHQLPHCKLYILFWLSLRSLWFWLSLRSLKISGIICTCANRATFPSSHMACVQLVSCSHTPFHKRGKGSGNFCCSRLLHRAQELSRED